MEVRQAIADIAEVRDRLATVQRFGGYSGWAAVSSGLVALAAGFVQASVAPWPNDADTERGYLDIWLVCLAFALAINYGAILVWRARNPDPQARMQVRTVGMSILPAIAAGGVITLACIERNVLMLLPGMWCATYALGIFASRALVPRGAVAIAVAFGFVGTLLLFAPGSLALSWWVMPIAFGGGQIAIGAIVLAERHRAHRRFVP